MNSHTLIRPVSQGMQDWFVLEQMQQIMRQHLQAGLIACSEVSRDLSALDPDQVMVDLRVAFDPHEKDIRDNFSNAFFHAFGKLKESGCEPLISSRAAE